MNDDYLWKGEGDEEPEVARLERALGSPAPIPPLPELPEQEPATSGMSGPNPLRMRLLLAAAAVLLLAPFGLRFLTGDDPAAARTYAFEALAGSPRVERSSDRSNRTLALGERLVCDAESRARVEVGEIGNVVLEPESTLRVADPSTAKGGEHLLHLERGSLVASIFAAPRVFQLGTPAGTAVDLGCVYRAEVDPDGTTLLQVVLGRVAFETDGRRVVVPEGASTRAHPGRGPGLPCWDEAPDAYRALVGRVDSADAPDDEDLVALLEHGESVDGLVLFHLMSHRDASVRTRTAERLFELVPPSPSLRSALLEGDADALFEYEDDFDWGW